MKLYYEKKTLAIFFLALLILSALGMYSFADTEGQLRYSLFGMTVLIGLAIVFLFYSINSNLHALHQKKNKLQKEINDIKNLYDNAPCGYLSVDSSLYLTNINQTLLNWLGYSSNEVVGKMKYEELLTPKSRKFFNETFEKGFEKYKQDGYVNNLEFDFQRKDGTTMPVIVNSVATLDHNGNFIGIRTTVFDNTEQRKTNEKLHESEERFRSIVTSVNDAIITINEEGNILTWNKCAEKIFGWSESEIAGKPVTTIMPEKYRAAHIHGLYRYKKTRESRVIGQLVELEGLRKDNSVFALELSLGSWDVGDKIYYCGVLRDISERKKVEAKFRGLLESSPDALVITKEDGVIQLVNKQCENVFGYKKEELIGQKVEILIPNQFRDKHPGNRKAFFSNPKVRPMGIGLELLGLRKNGEEFPVEISLSPLETEDGILVTAAIRDVTATKEFIAKINQLNKELDAFTYSVSHDLRAPLRSIAGYTQILTEDYHQSFDDEGKRITQVIISNANRMGQLIDNLLDFSHVGRKELIHSDLDMNKLVNDVLSELKPNENGRKINISLLPLHHSQGDLKLLRQVWTNLISNALKYSSKKECTEIEIGSSNGEGDTCYYVKDNGVGFNMKYVEKLFSVFQRLHKENEFEGTGVGLAFVKRIIQRHGGKVWAESEPDKGATFYFTLPKQIINE